jgi:hypothetical protein
VKASLSFDASAYTGIVLDSSSLAEMFASAGVPEDDRSLLTDIISEGVLSLSQEQCGIVLDTKNFVSTLVRAAAELKFSPEEGELPN